MQHVFIIGSRGLPARYGGFETFVEELVSRQQSPDICYHVACLSDSQHRVHRQVAGVDCFDINPPQLGPARVLAYDMMALTYAFELVKAQQIDRPIFYILGNTIGGLMAPFAWQIKRLGGQFFINPDGLEWQRSKWSKPVQAYLKLAEKAMCRLADLVIADNEGIEAYIKASYPQAKTRTIAYGTAVVASQLTADDAKVRSFFAQHGLVEKGYYLILGRFVPENNYASMLKAFMASQTQRDLVLVTNHEGSVYYQELAEQTGFTQDQRIKFVGTVYDKELVTYLRNQAFAYLHGHEVGGTNPSLLEALAQTDLNLVLDVTFNRSVALDTVYYWQKGDGSLTSLINQMDGQEDFVALGQAAKARIASTYTWDKIVHQYEELFLRED